MTQYEFNHLAKDQQMETLWQSGFVIGEKKQQNRLSLFYCLDDFFVEIEYNESAIKDIHSYKSPKKLSSYQHNTKAFKHN